MSLNKPVNVVMKSVSSSECPAYQLDDCRIGVCQQMHVHSTHHNQPARCSARGAAELDSVVAAAWQGVLHDDGVASSMWSDKCHHC